LANANVTIEPVEGVGLVKVLFKDLVLGVPASNAETVYNPVEGIHIIIPPGAWLPDARRTTASALTLTVFELPNTLGQACGPAIDLAPRAQRLAKPITLSTPCSPKKEPVIIKMHSLNTTTLLWTEDERSFYNDTVLWAETMSMGVHAALPIASSSPPHDPIVNVIVGCVIGGIVLLLLTLLILCAYKRAKVDEADRTMALSDLAFAHHNIT
jgi:hypothetical protein